MPSSVPPFIIQELSGQRRTITLTNRALPYRPFSLDGEQRVQVDFPAGYPEGVAQILGPTEGECSIEGFWKDKYLDGQDRAMTITRGGGANPRGASSNSGPVTSCVDAYRIFDSMRRSGMEVKVTWGPIIRYGHIKKFTHKWHNIHDMEWSIDFVWTSQRQNSYITAFPRAQELISASELRDLIAQFRRLLRMPFRMIRDFQNELNSIINSLNSAINEIDDAASGYLNLVTDTLSTANRVMNIATRAGSLASGLTDRLREVVPTGMLEAPNEALRRTTWAYEGVSPSQYARTQAAQRDMQDVARNMRDELVVRARTMETRASEVQTVYVARDGDDLRRVSNQYYGSPDYWRQLMMFNGLTDSALTAGQVVQIPRREG